MKQEKISNKKGKRFNEKKNKSSEKIIIILLILIVLIGIGTGTYFLKDYEKTVSDEIVDKKVEVTSRKLLEEKEYKGMKLKDISLVIDKSASYFKCNLENITDKKFEQEDAFVVFVKEDNSELARFKYKVKSIESNETEKISVTTTTSLIDAYDFYIETENK